MDVFERTELGKPTQYEAYYNPDKLQSLPRAPKRAEFGVTDLLPFSQGTDFWQHYEVSWLNTQGKPMVAIAMIEYPAHSPNLIESRSMNLYFNTFNQSRFDNVFELEELISKDITERVGATAHVKLIPLDYQNTTAVHANLPGINIDDLDITCEAYTVEPGLLKLAGNRQVTEVLTSNLLKSNCPITGQPDWASVAIHYTGAEINREALLQYLVSYRQHEEFHEQCIERIFIDIMQHCNPNLLSVEAKYTRRGGLDINPWRSNDSNFKPQLAYRLVRQ